MLIPRQKRRIYICKNRAVTLTCKSAYQILLKYAKICCSRAQGRRGGGGGGGGESCGFKGVGAVSRILYTVIDNFTKPPIHFNQPLSTVTVSSFSSTSRLSACNVPVVYNKHTMMLS